LIDGGVGGAADARENKGGRRVDDIAHAGVAEIIRQPAVRSGDAPVVVPKKTE